MVELFSFGVDITLHCVVKPPPAVYVHRSKRPRLVTSNTADEWMDPAPKRTQRLGAPTKKSGDGHVSKWDISWRYRYRTFEKTHIMNYDIKKKNMGNCLPSIVAGPYQGLLCQCACRPTRKSKTNCRRLRSWHRLGFSKRSPLWSNYLKLSFQNNHGHDSLLITNLNSNVSYGLIPGMLWWSTMSNVGDLISFGLAS